MELNNKLILIGFLGIIIMVGVSLWEINHFMPILKTCNDDFAVINKCGCIPPGNTIFIVPKQTGEYQMEINISHG